MSKPFEFRQGGSIPHRTRLVILIAVLYATIASRALAEGFVESRYQYYQEEHGRIRVDSDYSLFAVDLSDMLALDGSLLYSAISGASPSGLPPLVKGGPVPIVALTDERLAFSMGVTKVLGRHTLRGGFAYSDESDYRSSAYSLQDTISLNEKNTELVLGYAYTDDIVGENGTLLRASKRSSDAVIGVNQILSPNDLLNLSVSLGWRDGYLSDPYKRVLVNEYYVRPDTRPPHRFEQLAFVQWTHYVPPLALSMETSYRYGHNDFGSHSHTVQLALYKKLFHEHLVLRPAIRYYRQTAARFYDLQFFGTPQYASADYRLSAEETLSLSLEARWSVVKDKLSVDVGYERYATRGIDGKTPQSSYPDANSVSAGVHYQF